MSKSLGNFFTIRDILKSYDPEVVRFFILRPITARRSISPTRTWRTPGPACAASTRRCEAENPGEADRKGAPGPEVEPRRLD